jgi:hypothetical protein
VTRSEAHALLDRARAGEPVSAQAIADALVVTGDAPRHDLPVLQVYRPPGSWERAGAPMMARATWLDALH